MGKAGRRKRRQAAFQSRLDEARLDREKARQARRTATRPTAEPDWFHRQKDGIQVLIALGALVATIGGHFVLWGAVFPALGSAVGRVPVVSTVTGWLFGGGAVMAWGVHAINRDTAKPGTKKLLAVVAWSWTAVAVMCFPTGFADDVVLPVDFWAGVYASAYGVMLTPVAFTVVALGWWLLVDKLFGHKEKPTSQAVGWICVGYATLLLVWGSTLLRM